ncbi:uncharacterized protein LOC143293948 [Babylonia areolata]|uniref:uncharacterized protein LOC143293948 n=1 Tax=Babylonia areolata TaxID=304850 RepID=UPI003FD26E7B
MGVNHFCLPLFLTIGPLGKHAEMLDKMDDMALIAAVRLTHQVMLGDNVIAIMVGRSKPPPVSNSRSKRAILPFVCDLASSLFGVATSSDVRKLQKHVSRLYKMQISSSTGSVEQILIVIDVPIASTTTRFDLYQVMTFPVPFNASSSHATLVTNLPDFVADSVCHVHYV